MQPISNALSQNATPIEWRLRRDIQWRSSREGNAIEPVWIASDPLTRRVFRCGEHEYQLLTWLSEANTLEEVIERFHREFAPKTIDLFAIKQLMARCAQSGLMRSTAMISSQHQLLTQSRPLDLFGFDDAQRPESAGPTVSAISTHAVRLKPPTKNWLRALASMIVQLTQTQVSLCSPDRSLGWIAPKLGWLYSGTAVCLWLSVAAATFLLIGTKFDALWSELPSLQQLRSPGLLVGFGILFVVTRFFHELGHAVACKRAGAACKDVGLMMSFGMMCPYVDISDAWRLGNRIARIWIASAGVYTEIILSSIAGLIWYGTHPGWVHELALQTMLVCSVTTILFNANPLMKYDGYFVLSDWMKIQGLREKSFAALDNWLGSGRSGHSLGMTLFLIFYFIASSLNRLIITLGIISMIYIFATQWQVAGLGIGFIALYLVCTSILAAASWANSQGQHAGTRKSGSLATVVGWVLVGLLISLAVNIPLPNRVQTLGSFHVGTKQAVYASASGTVDSSLECQGEVYVEHDSALVRLRNDTIDRSLLELESRWIRLNQQLLTMERTAYFDEGQTGSMSWVRAQKLLVEKQLQGKRDEQAGLLISASSPGWFQPALAKPSVAPESPTQIAFGIPPSPPSVRPSLWTDKQSQGRLMERGTLVGWIVQDRTGKVECRLNEEQIAGISVGNEVRVRIEQNPTAIWTGKVVEIAKMSQTLRAGEQTLEKPDAFNIMAYQLRIEFDEVVDWSEYTHGNAAVVLLRPNQSLLHMATDQWLRNMRMR